MNEQTIICLIHGHGVDAAIWEPIRDDLSASGRVFVPDLARIATHQSIDEYADLIATYLRAEFGEAAKAVLVGHSMGGYVALAFADNYPDHVAGLVLFHSTAYADDDAKKEQRRETIAALETNGAVPFIEKTVPKMLAPDASPQLAQALVEQYRSLPADALAAGMTAIMNRPDRTHVLRDATYPVLVVLGREDQLIPTEKTQKLGDLSDNVAVEVLDGVGHLSMQENPDAATATLRRFLEKL